MNSTTKDSNAMMPALIENQEPLFGLLRNQVPEVVISGVYYFKTENHSKIKGSDPSITLVARSLLKPWQALGCHIDSDENFWSLLLSSHSGQEQHITVLDKMRRKFSIGDSELICPRCFPLDQDRTGQLKASGASPSRLFHPCSGKHLGMLATCKIDDISSDEYWDSSHPIQKRIASIVGKYLRSKPVWVTDSCGLPTIATTAEEIVEMWERLALNDEASRNQIVNLWTSNPRLIGGTNRLDSDLIELGEGEIIAKEGADGLLMVQSLPVGNAPVASCLIKLSSGYNSNHLALALWCALKSQSELPPAFKKIHDYLTARLERWVPRDQTLVNFLDSNIVIDSE